MITKGEITNIGRGLSSGFTVTLNLPDAILPELQKLEEQALTIEFKKYRNHRSGEANAYFHVLVGKIASVLHTSAISVKNTMIGRYGQPELMNDKLELITTQIEPQEMAEQEYLHTVLVHTKAIKDKVFYTYRVQRGSHTYDTKEMSELIDGTVQEAKDLGIETLPPDEIKAIEMAWKGPKRDA